MQSAIEWLIQPRHLSLCRAVLGSGGGGNPRLDITNPAVMEWSI